VWTEGYTEEEASRAEEDHHKEVIEQTQK